MVAMAPSGWPADRPVELASVEAPARVRRIHAAYRLAGAEVLWRFGWGGRRCPP